MVGRQFLKGEDLRWILPFLDSFQRLWGMFFFFNLKFVSRGSSRVDNFSSNVVGKRLQ